MSARLLVVEDHDPLRRLLERALVRAGHRVVAAGDCAAAYAALAAAVAAPNGGEPAPFDLVLTDLRLPDGSGLDVLRAARAAAPAMPVVVLTAFGSVATAVEAMKLGAADFVEKPIAIDELYRRVDALLGTREAPELFEPPGGAPPIVGSHPRLRAALRLLERVAPTESTVLLTGESGTGKELFARALHALSPRAGGPFVAINCAAIPETLIENELFGHERGAFTGAVRRQPGRFELAAGGTLLLDEVGELPLAVQGKVLRVLEERTFERVGGGATLRADVRLVAATNRRLREMVDRGELRTDLFYRLEVFPIELPALRERASDLPALARHLLRQAAARHHVGEPELSTEALARLAAQPWPGNVRELANLLERLVILRPGERVGEAALVELLAGGGESEEERLRRALRETGGDRRLAAGRLGVSVRTLQRWIRDLDLGGFPRYRG